MATAEVWQSLFHADHHAELLEISIPTLIVHGVADQSTLIDVTSRRTAKLVPNNVYREYPTAGHGSVRHPRRAAQRRHPSVHHRLRRLHVILLITRAGVCRTRCPRGPA